MIGHGLMYFFEKAPVKTALVIVALSGGFVYAGLDYLNLKKSDTVKIQEAKPITAEFSIIPKAYAGGDPIYIKGKLYGYQDPNVQTWKLAGEETILIYDKVNDRVLSMDAPALGDYRKGKK